jgi:cytochrome c-type biogenesis protein CcmH
MSMTWSLSSRSPAKAGVQGDLAPTSHFAALDPRFRGGAWLLAALLLAATGLFSSSSLAQNRLPPAPYAYQQLKDPTQEARAKALMEELRCLVCQGQSIADSDAPLAGDMRHEVRSKIAAGESPGEIKTWLVARYGNWVSYDPPFDAATAFLWLGPLLFLAIGGWLAFGRFRRGASDAEDAA